MTHQRASAVLLGLLSLPLPVAAQTGAVQTGAIDIWMRAFMPDPGHAAGASESIVQSGAGSSIVKLSLRNRDSECYATDHRGFSSDPSSTARLETHFSLIPTGRNTAMVHPASQRTSAAIINQVDCNTFVSLRSESGRVEKDHIGTPTVRDGTAHVAGHIVGKSAIAPSEQGPTIDYSFDLRWRPFPGELTATVSVGTFPAFEMYARVPGGEWVEVVRTLPSGKPGLIQLSDSVTLPVLDGTWESADAQRRFLLRIQGTSVVWTERDAAGAELTRQLPMWFGDDAATISRANDAEVLTFLGFQPQLRDQILARSPIPSFITLRIDEQGLLAEWFGVLAIKDEQDRLETLVQPGNRAPKRFRLQRRSPP
jgi:hypothetical protein